MPKNLTDFTFYLYLCNQVSANRRDTTLLRQKAAWMYIPQPQSLRGGAGAILLVNNIRQ